jgi:hypothetical protein
MRYDLIIMILQKEKSKKHTPEVNPMIFFLILNSSTISNFLFNCRGENRIQNSAQIDLSFLFIRT